MPLTRIDRLVVQHDAVSRTVAQLRRAGENGCEGIALWVGIEEGTTFRVADAYIPEQHCIKTESGIAVYVDGAELHRLNVWLYSKRLKIVAQLHSHPTDAYHSDTDDTFPIITELGGFSIVVPNFAAGPFNLSMCAVYRLGAGGWTAVPPEDVAATIKLE